MAIIGCYWDSKNLELLIECYDEVQNMYLSISGSSGKLSSKHAPTQADETAVQKALNKAFTDCHAAGSPATAIHYKGPHRSADQGTAPFKKSYTIKAPTLLAEAVLTTVDSFSNSKFKCDAIRKRSNIPTGKVLKAANALVTAYCSSSLNRQRKLALYGAMEIGDGKDAFKAIAKRLIKAQLKRSSAYTTQAYNDEQDAIFKKMA